jgi:hypothetical protein
MGVPDTGGECWNAEGVLAGVMGGLVAVGSKTLIVGPSGVAITVASRCELEGAIVAAGAACGCSG